MEDIHPLIRKRKSIRAFSTQVPSKEVIESLFEAARWAASSFNEQPWRFLVGIKGEPLHDKILGFLHAFNHEWAKNAPVLILSVVKEQFSHNNSDNLHAWHDLGLAMGNLSFEATFLGLGLRQLAGFDREECQKWLEQSFHEEGHQAVTVTAVGYPGSSGALSDHFQQAEQAPRKRKELSEFVLYSLD